MTKIVRGYRSGSGTVQPVECSTSAGSSFQPDQHRKGIIMKMRLFVTAAAFLLLLIASDVYSVSSAVKSSQDYAFTLDTIRKMRIMVENFGNDQNKLEDKFASIRTNFQKAGESYYGQDFDTSQEKFTQLKLELITILDEIGSLYLQRTKKILDSTSEQSFDTLIEYTKESGLAKYFSMPYDPMRDVKPYKPENYHLYHDRQKIENYLREGYKKYYKAKKVFEDPDIALLRKRSNLTMKNINYIIKSFTDVVLLCREAKQNGIEIHKILNNNKLGESLVKYNVSHGSIIPIYDDRIPEQPDDYKLDANDNIGLIHSTEKLKLKKYTDSKQ
jgi:hypothetical protein